MDCDKILNKYVLNNFKFNRNIMLGIIFTITLFIISISLIFTINSSVNKTVDNQIIDKVGDLQLTLYDVNKQDVNKYSEYDIYYSQNLGYSDFNSTSDKDKINIIGIDTDNFKKYPLTLKEGRLPENSNEIVITEDVVNKDKNKIYNLNNLVDLQLYDYFNSNGKKINQLSININGGIKKISTIDKEYKVVGIVELNNKMFYNYNSIGYVAFSKFDGNLTNDYIISMASNKKINTTEIKDFSNYSSFYNFDYINVKFNYILTIFKTLLVIVAIIIIIISVVITRKTLNGLYKQNLYERYNVLFSLGASQEQLIKCVKKEISLICGVSNLMAIIIITTILVIINLTITSIDVKFSFLGYILANSIMIYLITNLVKKVCNKIINNEYVYETVKNKNRDKYNYKDAIPFYINSASGILGYKNYKSDKKYFKTLIISSVMLIVCLITSYTVKEYYNTNYYYEISKDKPNILVYTTNQTNTEEINNMKYEDFKEIAKLDIVERSNILKDIYIKSQSETKFKDFKIIALSDIEYNKYIESIGFEEINLNGGVIWYNKDYSGNNVENNIKKVNDILESEDGKFKEEVKFVTDKLPFVGNNSSNSNGLYIINENNIDGYSFNYNFMYIYSEYHNQLKEYINKNYIEYEVTDLQADYEKNNKIIETGYMYINLIIIFIFLIGAISGINTIVIIMNNRKNTNKTLISLGASMYDFIKMFIIENIYILVKVVLLSLIYSFIITGMIYCFVHNIVGYPFIYTYNILIISSIIIFLCMNIINFKIYVKQNKV